MVVETLKNFNINKTSEDIYIFSVLNILNNLANDSEGIFEIINTKGIKTMYREQYKKKRREYVDYGQKILSGNYREFNKIKNYIDMLNDSLINFKENLNSVRSANYKLDILNSIVHMHCNRLTGNIDIESKYVAIVRHIVFDIIKIKKHTYFS